MKKEMQYTILGMILGGTLLSLIFGRSGFQLPEVGRWVLGTIYFALVCIFGILPLIKSNLCQKEEKGVE